RHHLQKVPGVCQAHVGGVQHLAGELPHRLIPPLAVGQRALRAAKAPVDLQPGVVDADDINLDDLRVVGVAHLLLAVTTEREDRFAVAAHDVPPSRSVATSMTPYCACVSMSSHHEEGQRAGSGHRRRWGSLPGMPRCWQMAYARFVPMMT